MVFHAVTWPLGQGPKALSLLSKLSRQPSRLLVGGFADVAELRHALSIGGF